MPTKPKSYEILRAEGKSHRTKAELAKRKEEEALLITGKALKERPEVRNNPVAHAEFVRVSKLLKGISKNDALYQSIVNRYAMIQAECTDFENKRERFYENMNKLDLLFDAQTDDDMTMKEYMKLQADMQKTIIDLDKQVMAKRKMLLDIEKECVMTIASALRSIPKKVVAESEDPLLKALRGE